MDPPVPCAQSCFLIRMWERENMDDSARKTIFLFFLSEESALLSSGWVLRWNVAELKFCAWNILKQRMFLHFCWLCFLVFCCRVVLGFRSWWAHKRNYINNPLSSTVAPLNVNPTVTNFTVSRLIQSFNSPKHKHWQTVVHCFKSGAF